MYRTVRRKPDAARSFVREGLAARPDARSALCVPGRDIARAHARAWRERPAARALGVCMVHLTPYVCARAAFSRHGAVKDVKMKEGYCFVDFENQGDADDAISRMDGYVSRPGLPPLLHSPCTLPLPVPSAAADAAPAGAGKSTRTPRRTRGARRGRDEQHMRGRNLRGSLAAGRGCTLHSGSQPLVYYSTPRGGVWVAGRAGCALDKEAGTTASTSRR